MMTYRLKGGTNHGKEVTLKNPIPVLFMTIPAEAPYFAGEDDPIVDMRLGIEAYNRHTMWQGLPGSPNFICWHEYWADGTTPHPTEIPPGFGDWRDY